MKILVNYQAKEKEHLPGLAFLLKQAGIQAVSTAQDLQIGELLEKAKLAGAQAILLCNEHTLRNVVPGERPTLDSYRGSRLNFSVPTIVCNSLTHIYTVPHGRWLLEKDIDKLKHLKKPMRHAQHNLLANEADFLQAIFFLKSCILMSFDVETDLLNEKEESIEAGDSIITCCAWSGLQANGSIKTFVLPLVSFREDHWKDDASYARALQFMQEVNALPVPKVMHNGCYDAVHSLRYRAAPSYWILDTMGLAHSQWAELPKTLDFVASYQLYDYLQWKDEANSASKQKDILKYWAYNAKDAFYTLLIAIEQLRNMPAWALRNYKMQFPLVYPVLYCAMEGLRIDEETRAILRIASETALQASLAELRVMLADPNFNPGSWQQVEKYIYQVLGAKRPRIGKSKSCTDEKNLKAVAEQHPLLARIVDHILTYRGEQKAIGTYFNFKQVQGRLLYSLDPFGTESGRMACRASSLWAGTQVQNIPKYAKKMLIADEGYEIFEVDNNKSEARCTAYLSQDEALIAVLEEIVKDFYRLLGTMFFQIPYEEVTDFFRNKVLKKIVHGINYLMGADTFIENIGVQILHEAAAKLSIKLVPIPQRGRKDEMTIKQFATSLLETYHTNFPQVREWYKEIYHEILTTQMLTSPLDHVRYFFGDISKNHNMLRGAVAHQPQNLSVSILNKGLLKIYREIILPSAGAVRLKAQIHDSVLGQWRIDERDKWLPLVQEALYNPVTVHGRTLIIPTETKVGVNWLEMRDV